MRSEHFETYHQGQCWWATSRVPWSGSMLSSGATELEAVGALVEKLFDALGDALDAPEEEEL